MTRIPRKWIFYFVYTASLFILFLYLLFPANAIKSYLQTAIARTYPGCALDIGGIAPSPPIGVTLTSVTLSSRDIPLLEIDRATFAPKPFSLMGSRPEISFHAAPYEGKADGSLVLDPQYTGIRAVDAIFSGTDIRKMAPIQNLSKHAVSGRLSGTLRYQKEGATGKADADLTAAEFAIRLEKPVFSIDAVAFSQVQAQLTLTNRSTLEIRSMTAKGEQVSGSLSGTVTVRHPLSDSQLNLNGTFRPHPAFSAKLGQMAAMVFKSKRGGGDFSFTVTGSLGTPNFSIK